MVIHKVHKSEEEISVSAELIPSRGRVIASYQQWTQLTCDLNPNPQGLNTHVSDFSKLAVIPPTMDSNINGFRCECEHDTPTDRLSPAHDHPQVSIHASRFQHEFRDPAEEMDSVSLSLDATIGHDAG
jgi:hypothetical protein